MPKVQPANVDWSKYRTIAFVDSNIALEGQALGQLPWADLDNIGPILVLVVPAVLQEVDSKKNHARLGDHARRFNKSLRAVLAAGRPAMVRASPAPVVEIGLAHSSQVDWGEFPGLSFDEPDDKVVAQALVAARDLPGRTCIVSHDIRPIYLARACGLEGFLVGDPWLRPKEISESDKKLAQVRRELDEMRKLEPEIHLSWSSEIAAIDIYRVMPLSDKERADIQQQIVHLNPMPRRPGTLPAVYDPVDSTYDSSIPGRYRRWETEVLPTYMRDYERKLELSFGQVEVRLLLRNTGTVPAEALHVRLTAATGWLNGTYVIGHPRGPLPPQPRPFGTLPAFWPQDARQHTQPGKHDFVVITEQERSPQLEFGCEDFRHGSDHEIRCFAWADPRTLGPFRIKAEVTAKNLHGIIDAVLEVGTQVSDASVFDLVEPDDLKFRTVPPVLQLYLDAVGRSDLSDFTLDGSSDH